MRISPYGIMALVMLGISTPVIAFAETENEAGEGTSEIGTYAEHEGNDKNPSSFASSDLVLMTTILAIAGVAGYSAWKVYKARRRVASKSLV